MITEEQMLQMLGDDDEGFTSPESTEYTPTTEEDAKEAEMLRLLGDEDDVMWEAEEAELKQRLENIPLAFGPWEADTAKLADYVTDDGVAAIVGMGHMMQDSWRGIKQMAGLDDAEEAAEERLINELYASEEYGTETLAGGFAGAAIDPIGWAIGGVAGKGALGLRFINDLNKTAKTAAVGGIAAGLQTGTGYVDPEGPFNRAGLALLGTTLGGVVGGVAGKISSNVDKKVLNEQIDDLEGLVGARTSRGTSIKEAVKQIKEEFPEVIEQAKEASAVLGRSPDLANAGRNFAMIEEAGKGLKPLDTIPRKTKGEFANSFDKVVGVVSARVKSLNPRFFGKLRKYEGNVSARPHTFVEMRRDLDLFFKPSSAEGQRRARKAGANWLSDEQVEQFNYYVLNSEFDKARDFLKAERGQRAVDAFNDSLQIYKQIGDENKAMGVVDEFIKDYWHRALRPETRDEFLAVLHKNDAGKADWAKKWEDYLRLLNKKSEKRRGHGLSEVEESNAFRRFVLKDDRANISTIGLAKDRKIKHIKREWVKYYANPIEAMDSYIHRSIAEIEKAKLFGKDAYAVGLKNADDIDGLFNLDKALEYGQSHMFKGMDPLDQEELVHLLRVRFGNGMAKANAAVGVYKGLVNMLLLTNPVSAATQLGDLGVSMYKNGVLRASKAFLRSAFNAKDRVTIKDLGIDARFTEFEDMSGLRRGGDWKATMMNVQDRMFKWSGFQLVDRLGKESLVNSALDKSLNMVTKRGKAYKAWRTKLRTTMGEDFDTLESDLVRYAAGGRKKEDVTDEIRAYLLSELADIQPISKSEMPELYLTSNWGKTAYTLKTFMMKQLDVVRQDVLKEVKNGNYAAAGKNLSTYVLALGVMGSAADSAKDLMTGKFRSWELPEEKGLELAAIMTGNLALASMHNTMKAFGVNEYTIKDIKQSGVGGYFASLIPPFPIADEMAKIALTAIDGGGVSPHVARLGSMVPLVGRLGTNWMKEQEKSSSSVLGHYAEGGEVVDDSTPLEQVLNDDQSVSTERTTTAEIDGKWYNIPTIDNGVDYGTPERAIEAFKLGQIKAVGSYDSLELAEEAAKKRSVMLGKALEVDPMMTHEAQGTSGQTEFEDADLIQPYLDKGFTLEQAKERVEVDKSKPLSQKIGDTVAEEGPEVAEVGAEFLPGADAIEALNAIERRDYKAAALHAGIEASGVIGDVLKVAGAALGIVKSTDSSLMDALRSDSGGTRAYVLGKEKMSPETIDWVNTNVGVDLKDSTGQPAVLFRFTRNKDEGLGHSRSLAQPREMGMHVGTKDSVDDFETVTLQEADRIVKAENEVNRIKDIAGEEAGEYFKRTKKEGRKAMEADRDIGVTAPLLVGVKRPLELTKDAGNWNPKDTVEAFRDSEDRGFWVKHRAALNTISERYESAQKQIGQARATIQHDLLDLNNTMVTNHPEYLKADQTYRKLRRQGGPKMVRAGQEMRELRDELEYAMQDSEEYKTLIEKLERVKRLDDKKAAEGNMEIQELLRGDGYDSIKYRNFHEGEGDWSYILFDEDQVRYYDQWGSPVQKKETVEEVVEEAPKVVEDVPAKEVTQPQVEKLEAGVYTDPNGNFFEVTEDGKLKAIDFGDE